MAEASQSVTADVPVRAEALFAVLADPQQHPAIDGSGMVRRAVTTERISKVGDVFRMAMSNPAFGDYEMDNHVVDFEEPRRIAWAPAMAGAQPLGHRWTWELQPNGDSTTVTQTYDWSGVKDEAILKAIPFPVVSAADMEESIQRAAKAAAS